MMDVLVRWEKLFEMSDASYLQGSIPRWPADRLGGSEANEAFAVPKHAKRVERCDEDVADR